MVRSPFFDENGKKKGAWSLEEDNKLRSFIHTYGIGKWHQVPKYAGLDRCEKSCRLRWINYLSPDVKKGNYTKQEVCILITLHQKLGNRWSAIAKELPGRTDNDIKNYWHTHLKKRFTKQRHNESRKSYEIDWPRELKEPSTHAAKPSKTCEDSISLRPPILDSSQLLVIGSSSEIPSVSKLMFPNGRRGDEHPPPNPSNNINGGMSGSINYLDDLEEFIQSELLSFIDTPIYECNNIYSVFNDVGRVG